MPHRRTRVPTDSTHGACLGCSKHKLQGMQVRSLAVGTRLNIADSIDTRLQSPPIPFRPCSHAPPPGACQRQRHTLPKHWPLAAALRPVQSLPQPHHAHPICHHGSLFIVELTPRLSSPCSSARNLMLSALLFLNWRERPTAVHRPSLRWDEPHNYGVPSQTAYPACVPHAKIANPRSPSLSNASVVPRQSAVAAIRRAHMSPNLSLRAFRMHVDTRRASPDVKKSN